MRQARVLIAEDEVRVSQAFSRALSMPEGGGYLVETRESGEEAFARFREVRFDLLITDLRMPGMNGFELIGKCREVSPELRSILITAFGSPDVEDKAYQLAVNVYLTKPFSMRKFVRAVHVALQGSGDAQDAYRPLESDLPREMSKI